MKEIKRKAAENENLEDKGDYSGEWRSRSQSRSSVGSGSRGSVMDIVSNSLTGV